MGPKEREIKRRLRVLEHAEKIATPIQEVLVSEGPFIMESIQGDPKFVLLTHTGTRQLTSSHLCIRPDDYYPTPAPNAEVIGKPQLNGWHLIILNISGRSTTRYLSSPIAPNGIITDVVVP
ncbi:MAG: hypothetical protein E4H27_08000 [Anaerolineales bacterium]|nr:MAG: hypothetical protein E4H27_08000 [Anaerolineales bacterium]